MKSLAYEGIAEHTMKKSRFIGYAIHIKNEEEAQAYIDKIKKLHPQARHHVSAYRISQEILERYDDDNEPKSTAGLPILTSIQQGGVDCVCIVVVRYFGGILLGKGGLVKAYTLAAQLALDQGKLVDWESVDLLEVEFDYSQQGSLDFQLDQAKFQVEERTYLEKVAYKVLVEEKRRPALEDLLQNFTSGQVDIRTISQGRAPILGEKILLDKMEER